MYETEHSLLSDLDVIMHIYTEAVNYQKAKGYNLWPIFERSLIEKEINDGRHFKIIENGNIACVFSVVYEDPIIWREKNSEPSVYLHRIATNHGFKGKGMMQLITNWAHKHATENKKQFVRMDTWGDNENLKNYYMGFGFKHLGKIFLPENHELPSHYWGNTLSLFEIKL